MLIFFEQLSGMSINYHKSELIAFNMEKSDVLPSLDILQWVEAQFPIKYMRLPLHFVKFTIIVCMGLGLRDIFR
jgi:hypothetical protein